MDALERQIKKNKTRLEKRLREGAFDSFDQSMELDEEKKYDVLRIKHFSLKPMSIDEAILQMNLLGHQFFLFNNADTSTNCVVYKRNDGGYGLIMPERL